MIFFVIIFSNAKCKVCDNLIYNIIYIIIIIIIVIVEIGTISLFEQYKLFVSSSIW